MGVYEELRRIQKEYPALTFQNEGFEYIDKDILTIEDTKAIEEVSKLLKQVVGGFVKFNNFKIRENGGIAVRVQCFYDASFIGVDYIPLENFKTYIIT